MALTRADGEGADDLGSALAHRFGSSAPSKPTEGDDLLPGDDLVEELRSQVELLEEMAAHTAAPRPAPEFPVAPALPADEFAALAPPALPPPSVRFGPTAFAPPPTPFDLDAGFPPPMDEHPTPIDDAVVEAAAFDPPAAPVPAPEPVAEPEPGPVSVLSPAINAPGAITVKKSSVKKDKKEKPAKAEKPEKSGRRLFGKKDAGGTSKSRASAGRIFETQADGAAPEAANVVAVDEHGPRHVGRPLGELLVGRGIVSEDQLREALTTQTGSGKRLGNILVELGLLSERALVDVLAEQLQLEIVELGRMELDKDVVTLLPEDHARRLRAVPIARDGARLDVAVADPLATNLQEELIELLGTPVRLQFATGTDIENVIDKMHANAADLGDALRMFEARLTARKGTREHEQATTTTVDENAPIVKVVNLILEQAVRARASDVHIEPMADVVRIRVRTDGALHETMSLPGSMGGPLVSRIKVMSDMNIVERRKPQDGQLQIQLAGRDLDVRVSTTPTVFGEKCVMRVLDKTKAVIDLPGLGMDPETHQRFTDLIRSPYGMVICAGPTGSGKTTTLYATLTAVASDDINVVTIEDPVEYVFPKISQIQINETGGLTFASGLRAILRQDPDSILVGEIRDVETARIAVQAALTGHFVMSSLHATDAASALHRFMDMGIEPFLVASSLLGVVGQRLVRKICPHCITVYDPTPDERSFYERAGGVDKDVFVQGAGCNFCDNTGYYDRVGIYEVLAVTDELKQLIVSDASNAELRALAVQQGMRTLREQALQLVQQDKTTIAEVLRTVYVL
jgi:type IV pilus assembly protein PilB